MRSFIGIDFSSRLKREVADFQELLKEFAVSGRWKRADNFHLTLKFLDEISDAQVQAIDAVLKRISWGTKEFCLNISHLGSFPGKGCLRVLWLSVSGDLQQLSALQNHIETGLAPIGFEKERRKFIPHITIAQDVIFDRDFEKIKKLAAVQSFSEIKADHLSLFKSEQIRKNRVYTPLKEYKLG
ncbi:MAG: RNA 2',3'-cyclic phosphodiesterase [Clostridiales bacterium]|jgi:2'-5' RNA ligase|nr:RNA 2',3'-cyclic phosphodiesterase [Eubacteriales bacterium]MDH7564867.1 RNA 2',3'-cyclic phosphodiesterase [Clostridiales bacterium]